VGRLDRARTDAVAESLTLADADSDADRAAGDADPNSNADRAPGDPDPAASDPHAAPGDTDTDSSAGDTDPDAVLTSRHARPGYPVWRAPSTTSRTAIQPGGTDSSVGWASFGGRNAGASAGVATAAPSQQPRISSPRSGSRRRSRAQ
jgi:hypothetical protein